MREERKRRLKEVIKKGNEWLKSYRSGYKKQMREQDKEPRIIELKRRWKRYKKWIFENGKKYNLNCQTAGHACYTTGAFKDKPEIKRVWDQLYILTETEFERKYFQEVRGDPKRENMLSTPALRKWSHIDIARYLGNRKGYGIGRLVRARWFDEIISRESRECDNDISYLLFRTLHFNRGIGEWKELPDYIREKIPFPLVYRPIKDKHGYAVIVGTESIWERRPLHPAEAWRPWNSVLWARICTHFLWLVSTFVIKHPYPWWSTAGGYHYRPFDRWLRHYSIMNRIFFGLIKIL